MCDVGASVVASVACDGAVVVSGSSSALTANAVSGAREMFLEAGFDEYISKPIELDKFDKVLREYLPEEKLRFTAGKEAGDHA